MLKSLVLHHAHVSKLSSHLSFKKTLARTHPYYKWKNLHSDVYNYCQSCQSSNDHKKPKEDAPIQEMPKVTYTFKGDGLDILGTLPVTIRGNTYSGGRGNRTTNM